MRVLSIVHEADAGPGVFAQAAVRRHADLVEWVPAAEGPPGDVLGGYVGVLVLGGAMHPDQEREHPWLAKEKRLLAQILDHGVPTLGVCLGAELVAEVAGGSARRLPSPEIGWRDVRLTRAGAADPVLGRLPERFTSLQWHSYACEPPRGAVDLARGGAGVDAFRIGEAWGIQFHPEVTVGIVEGWLDHHAEDRDAVAVGFDPEPVRAATSAQIQRSNELGEALFAGFLDRAAEQASG